MPLTKRLILAAAMFATFIFDPGYEWIVKTQNFSRCGSGVSSVCAELELIYATRARVGVYMYTHSRRALYFSFRRKKHIYVYRETEETIVRE